MRQYIVACLLLCYIDAIMSAYSITRQARGMFIKIRLEFKRNPKVSFKIFIDDWLVGSDKCDFVADSSK